MQNYLIKSIYDNVAIGRPVASYDEVMNALKLAQCDSILDKLPQRENTVVGSQSIEHIRWRKAKVAIARAILKNSNIIILDEAHQVIRKMNIKFKKH